MNAKAVVFISCRLIAIYLVIAHPLHLAIQLAAGLFAEPALRQDLSFLPVIGAMAFGVALYGLVAFFLWIAAGPLSRLISKPFPETFEGDMDLERWQAVIVMALGGVALIHAAKIGGEILKADVGSNPLANTALPIAAFFAVIGLGMIVLSRHIVHMLNRAREWGNKPLVRVDEE